MKINWTENNNKNKTKRFCGLANVFHFVRSDFQREVNNIRGTQVRVVAVSYCTILYSLAI